jgi:hypothetical protein
VRRRFDQGVQGQRKAVVVGQHGRLLHALDLKRPPPGRAAPPAERVDHQGLDLDRRQLQEIRTARRGEQQHPGGQPPQPPQFVGDHPGVLGDHRVGDGPPDELRMAKRHGDGRAQLVGGVLQEPALLFQQPQVLRRDPLHLRHRRQPLRHRRQPPATVPDHHQEHHRDQGNLGEVLSVLLTACDLHADHAAGGQRHRRQRQDGGLQPPQPEAVNRGQAHPDGQKRDGLPGGQQPHRRQVDPDEHHPGDVHPVRATPLKRSITPHPRGLPE